MAILNKANPPLFFFLFFLNYLLDFLNKKIDSITYIKGTKVFRDNLWKHCLKL